MPLMLIAAAIVDIHYPTSQLAKLGILSPREDGCDNSNDRSTSQ